MPNLKDYLDWRGDIPATKDNINEVDNLIFCLLSYVDFEGILPRDPAADGMTLREAAKEYFFAHNEDEHRPLGLIIPAGIIPLFRRLADTPRFQNVYLTGYVNEVCPTREMQFSALTVVLPDRGFFVAFRGTDDTIVGWKEDFKLSYMDEVPAQRMAAAYLDHLPLKEGDTLYVGGHSKGGNLAVWGAVHASEGTQKAVKQVFCNDGPGFTATMLNSEAYRRLSDRLTFLIPGSSLVGLLLSNDASYQIIKSRTLGVFQHNALSWEVMGPAFIRQEKLSSRGVHTDTVVRERIDAMSKEERQALVGIIFEVLESTGATTLTELSEGKMKTALTMLKTYQSFGKDKKELFAYLFGKLFDPKPQAVKDPPKEEAKLAPKKRSRPQSKIRVCLNLGHGCTIIKKA